MKFICTHGKGDQAIAEVEAEIKALKDVAKTGFGSGPAGEDGAVKAVRLEEEFSIDLAGTSRKVGHVLLMTVAAGRQLGSWVAKTWWRERESQIRLERLLLRMLAELAAKGLVHQDLQPAHLFLTAIEGDDGLVLHSITVLGFRKAIVKGETDAFPEGFELTRGGTPQYLAPAVCHMTMTPEQSDLVDVLSVAVILGVFRGIPVAAPKNFACGGGMRPDRAKVSMLPPP